MTTYKIIKKTCPIMAQIKMEGLLGISHHTLITPSKGLCYSSKLSLDEVLERARKYGYSIDKEECLIKVSDLFGRELILDWGLKP